MAFGTRCGFEAVREVAFGSITNAYVALGPPVGVYPRLVVFTNSTDKDVYVSLNGVTNHLRIAAASFKLFDITSDKVNDAGFFFQKGTQFYIKFAVAPGAGEFWIEVAGATAGGV